MPTFTDNAICIRLWDWSETSQTVSLFTQTQGLLRGIAKGAKRPNSTFSGGFELLTMGQIVAIIKPTNAMATLTEWDLQNPFRGIRTTLSGFYHALYVGDLTQHCLTENDPHPKLFDSLLAALDTFANNPPSNHASALVRFQWDALTETGYKPDLTTASSARTGVRAEAPARAQPSVRTYAFNPALGRLENDPGRDTGGLWRARAETVEVLRALDAGVAPDTISGKSLDESIGRANRLLGAYLARLLGRPLPSGEMVLGGSAG